MIPAEKEAQLRELVSVFLAENAKLNLSAFRTEENCWIGNILDSIAFVDIVKDPETPRRVLDIGTGGGFPLLPLAICYPHWSFTGLDSTQKKIDAIRRICETMNIHNIELVCARAEERAHHPKFREQFDFVLSRAVAPMNTLLEYAAPFATVSGHIVLWKSTKIEEELEQSLLARAELSVHLKESYKYTLPGDWGDRLLLILEKTFTTKHIYPRDIGIPKKTPLL